MFRAYIETTTSHVEEKEANRQEPDMGTQTKHEQQQQVAVRPAWVTNLAVALFVAPIIYLIARLVIQGAHPYDALSLISTISVIAGAIILHTETTN